MFVDQPQESERKPKKLGWELTVGVQRVIVVELERYQSPEDEDEEDDKAGLYILHNYWSLYLKFDHFPFFSR